jgi:iron complex outermembrane receptor protein
VAGTRLVRDGYVRRANPPFAPTTYTETNLASEGADDRYSGRVQLRWLADDTLSVDLTADASRRRGTQTATHLDAVNPQAIGSNLATVNRLVREGNLPGPEITNALVSPDLLVSSAGGGNRISQDIVGVSLNAVKSAGSQDIHVTLAYRRLRSKVATDADGTWFNLLSSVFDETANQYSAELRTSGSNGALTYTTGVFAYHEDGGVLPVTGAGQDVLYFCGCLYTSQTLPRTLFPARQIEDTSYAAYAQGTLRLGSRLSATFGARYSIDRKSIDAQLVLLDPATLAPTSQIVGTGANLGRWASFTWRAGAEFQTSRDLMVYVSAARGFKSGGFNVRPVVNLVNLGLAPYAPETATAYEAGLRSQWFANRLRFNLTLFQTDYRDIQLRQQTILGGVVTTLVENAARARIRGIEIEIIGRPVTGLTLGVAYGYLDPHFLDVGLVPGLTLTSDFQRTPHHSLTASFEYRLPLGSGVLAWNADYSYRSHEQFQITATPWDQAGYGLIGARLAWHAPGDRWSCALFGTNLTDRRYRTAGRGTLLGSAGFAYSEVGPPRQLGVQIKVAY